MILYPYTPCTPLLPNNRHTDKSLVLVLVMFKHFKKKITKKLKKMHKQIDSLSIYNTLTSPFHKSVCILK